MKMFRKASALLLMALVAIMASTAALVSAADPGYYDETYRPQYHYSAEASFLNDPNGLLYANGEYHMFYQSIPYTAIQTGPKYWGHAVSTDLVHWQQLPPPIAPDGGTVGILSGTAVIDTNNTAGFGAGAMVAVYAIDTAAQDISIAYSTDNGRTFTKYVSNPVLLNPNPSYRNFRDPKVFWHAGTNKWVMVVAAGDRYKFYTSTNLKSWTFASDFGPNQGVAGNAWECPDLFPLQVDGNGATKWVLIANVLGGTPGGGSGWQYFIGDFNGTAFTNSNGTTSYWGDYAKDDYAGITFEGAPSGRRILLPWASNWDYVNQIPVTSWSGQMGAPKELALKTFAEGIRLTQNPVAELTALRGTASSWGSTTVTPGSNLLSSLSSDSYELLAEFQANTSTASQFGFKVRKGGSQYTTIGYDKTNAKMFIDRNNSGMSGFSGAFPARHEAPLSPDSSGKIKLRILVDRSSVEVFGNDGKSLLSDLIFPDASSKGLELYATGANVTLNSLSYYPLAKIWGSSPFVSNLSGWTTASGNWADTFRGKQGNRESADGLILSSGTGSDFTYEADVNVLKGNAGALVFRSNASGTNSYVANVDAAYNVVKLFKFVNGTVTIIGQTTPSTAIAREHNYHLKVVAAGTSIKVYLDGTLMVNGTDSSHSSGQYGLNIFNGTAAFQNVQTSATGSGGGSGTPANAGFEVGGASQSPSSWSTWAGTSGTSGDADYSEASGSAHGGSYQLTHSKASAYELATYQSIAVANGSYTVKAWIKSSGGQNAAYMYVNGYGGTEKQANLPTTSTWTQITIPNVLVTNGTMDVGFYSNANGGNWASFDDVTVVPSSITVANAGFEQDGAAVQSPSSWSTWAGTSGTSADADYAELSGTAHGGNYQLAHYKTSAYELATYQSQSVPNGTYTVTAWVKSGGGQSAAYMYVNGFGGTEKQANLPTTSTWTQITISNVVVTNGTITIGFYSNASGGKWALFDDVSIVGS